MGLSLRQRIFLRLEGLLILLIIAVFISTAAFDIPNHYRDSKALYGKQAHILARQSSELILWDDRFGLKKLLTKVVQSDEAIGYAFIENNTVPLVHTFAKGVPQELLALYSARVSVEAPDNITLEDEQGQIWFNISVRLEDSGTTLHMGIAKKVLFQRSIHDLKGAAVFMLVLFLIGTAIAKGITSVTTLEVDAATDSLKRSEERFRSVTQSASDAIISVDHEGRILSWNRGAEMIFGYSQDEILGQPVDRIIPERYRQSHHASFDVAVKIGTTKLAGQALELMALHKDGHECQVELTLGDWTIGKVHYFSAVIRDISERKKAEEALRGKKVAEAANQAKSHFLATMSHEIRTPLNSILGMGELLRETQLNETQAWYVKTLSSSGNTLFNLINDILDLSKVEAGQLTLEHAPFNLKQLVEESYELFTFSALEKGIAFDYQFGEGLSQWVMGDQTRLRQVLLNLIGNAIKFTQHGSVTLTVEERKEGKIAFVVTDTGPGIPKEKQAEIFHPFTQADTSTTRAYGGTGLGLTICRRLANLMGGGITLQSTAGQGSAFTFTAPLPAAGSGEMVTVEALTSEMPSPSGITPANKAEQSLKILLVDDALDNRLLVQAFLKKSPHRLVMAENGADAVAQFKSQQFDLVFMDIQMPVMDGYQATRKIRAWEVETGAKPTPILALTAHALTEESEQIKAAGCDLHLTKPIQKKRLLGAIHQFMG
ncbi:MAG: PAS domain S-box protein [Magnetococcales bacterium]|nr:PAS domain S-box protein [Magnetococcales bacterium]